MCSSCWSHALPSGPKPLGPQQQEEAWSPLEALCIPPPGPHRLQGKGPALPEAELGDWTQAKPSEGSRGALVWPVVPVTALRTRCPGDRQEMGLRIAVSGPWDS